MNNGLPPETWDAELQHHGGGILQSRPWAEFQHKLGRDVVYASGKGWMWLAGVRHSKGINYLMCSYGPVAESATAMRAAIIALRTTASELKLDFVRLEPQAHATPKLLASLGARPIYELDPTYTSVVDLSVDEAALRSQLNSSHRNRVNGTERRGIKVIHSGEHTDFDTFLSMLHDTAARSKVTFFPDSYFSNLHEALGDASKLYIATTDEGPVAAAMFYDWGNTRYYAHAGAFQEINRKVKASVSLVWQAMLDAKADGKTRFDLWGVAPEGDTKHHLSGLSMFKYGFGGATVEYAGTWDLPVNPRKYRLYTVYRKLRGLE